MATADALRSLTEQVLAAAANREPLRIEGSGSKAFYGRDGEGAPLALSEYSGIVSYEPTELVITARAGTPLGELEAALDEAGQAMPFEPPRFGGAGTLGGAIATGLSGPRRPYAGAARDFVLGARCLNGRAEDLQFGGQVMKNVAGYDVTRLLTGSMGTLAVLLEVSLKVLPKPEQELGLTLETQAEPGFAQVERWVGESLPVSAAAHDGERLHVRLSGAASTVALAAKQIGGEPAEDRAYWQRLRDHDLPFFHEAPQAPPLWRIALPSGAGPLQLDGVQYHEWGGRLRWLRTNTDPEAVWAAAARLGGHATLFRGGDRHGEVFQPLSEPLLLLHRRLKASLDPSGVFNPGRLYAAL
jgi:glycolate oxidase FAD binding subunit